MGRRKTIVKNINKLTISALILVIILVLFFSTNMVLAIPEKGYFLVNKSSFAKLQNNNSNFIFRVDTFNRNEDVRQTVDLTGYAYFAPSQPEVFSKRISLVFSSPKATYLVETDLSDRFDLRNQLNQSKVIGTTHGFRSTFSPLGMVNGTYDLYIYCFENDNDVGYIKTDKVFIKQYDQFIEEGTVSPEKVK